MLAVIDLADTGEFSENKIYLQQLLMLACQKYFK
jgi:hypothetical protein